MAKSEYFANLTAPIPIIYVAQKEGYGRGTNVFKQINGRWMVVHEHLSVLDKSR
ncbi:nuclear transport factor 2 family protein [Scopulibacillus darangshiensis]|uniref:nuclear transport factor 2 family protein n=1 Tax=Scopulibacillus darangshiensis TaxID=442528 RepID=UPI0024364FE4|nr:nuclear transport factor 2 family protein [Scopulibacillus darangshiensis]